MQRCSRLRSKRGHKDAKKVIVINGKGGVGKDTLCDAVSRKYAVLNCSSITPIKDAAEQLGWGSNDKSDKARKFLSDLKMLSSGFNDFPFNYLLDMYDWFVDNETAQVMFVHIREPEEIAKFKAKIPECKTLLVKSSRVERTFGNMADDNVDSYNYDYVYYNDKPLEEVEADFMEFFERM